MRTETSARSLPLVLRALLAPAFWLERAKGRKRIALAFLYMLVLLFATLLAWRAASLNGLPDVGEPFDRTALERINISEPENAFTFYRQAIARLKRLSAAEARLAGTFQPWGKAPDAARDWLERNREALALWRQGTERSEAVLVPPSALRFETDLGAVEQLGTFARLALLEATRLQEGGDLEGAWGWYRAVLRSSRHVGMHGCVSQRLAGYRILFLAGGPISAWARSPGLDAPLLRRALDDMLICESLTPPASEAIQIEYLPLIKALDDTKGLVRQGLPGDKVWYHHFPGWLDATLYFYREPERSKRVARLVFANWLSQCDRAPPERKAAGAAVEFYQPGPEAAPAARALAPEALMRWCDSTLILRNFLTTVPNDLRSIDRETLIWARLEVTLADQLY
ncbi:MAG TPA: hypothetical protein VGY53_08100, partial [Isosphaeraceae bacterium]|nr:hypothetical protein [Isosphaeraceae bacterium]